MKKSIWILFCIIMYFYSGCGFMQPDQSLKITRNGRSRYRIVIADNASPSTRHGARELRLFLYKMTGAALPIVTDGPQGAPLIQV